MKLKCEISARHIHLSQKHLDELIGEDLENIRDLCQPGQFLSRQRVTLVGPKGNIANVAVLGPTRPDTQVELARTDTFILGIKDVPVRQSGHVGDTPGVTIRYGEREITIDRGVMLAKRHIHMTPEDAEKYGFTDGKIVSVAFDGERGGTLNNTVVRVNPTYATAVHIDVDEANAMGFTKGEVEVTT